MTTVYWTPYTPKINWSNLTFFEPEPVLPYIAKQRDCSSKTHFTKCPAFQDYYRNVYVIKAPIDITITYDKHQNYLTIYPQDQDFFNSHIIMRGNQVGANDPFLMSMSIAYLFIADAQCAIEQLPVTHHDKVVAEKIRLIQGTFDISKWYRPTDFAFELLTPDEPLVIKRGDPLFYVRFVSKDKIKLDYREQTKEVTDIVMACTSIKSVQQGLGLQTLYKLAERLRNKLWFNKKKCPFNWRNK